MARLNMTFSHAISKVSDAYSSAETGNRKSPLRMFNLSYEVEITCLIEEFKVEIRAYVCPSISTPLEQKIPLRSLSQPCIDELVRLSYNGLGGRVPRRYRFLICMALLGSRSG